MSKARDLFRLSETVLSDLGDRFETIVKALRDAGFVTSSFSKGDAFTSPTITLDNGIVITINTDTGALEIGPDSSIVKNLHPKQRFFNSGDLIQALTSLKK